MKNLIEWIKRIFRKRVPALENTTTNVEKSYVNEKEKFTKAIKIDGEENNLLVLQKKLENGLIDEDNLGTEQVAKIKDFYYNQIINLMENIKKYKLKLEKSS